MRRRTPRKISIRAHSVVQLALLDTFLMVASERKREWQGFWMISSLSNAHPTPVSLRRTLLVRRIATVFFLAALGLSIELAHAGPCSAKIAQFELAVRQSAGKPNAGPLGRNRSAHRSIANQRRPQSNGPRNGPKRSSQRPWHAPSGLMHKAIELDVDGHSQPPRICTICNERLVRVCHSFSLHPMTAGTSLTAGERCDGRIGGL